IGAFFIGSWTVLALVAAWFAEVSILIERDAASDGEPSAAAETVERMAGGVAEKASSAVATARSGIGSAIGTAAHAAGDLARRAADTLEERMAAGEKAAETIIQAAESAEPRQCAALTRAGTRCKRTAVAGSDY